jgi:hypothetical protein
MVTYPVLLSDFLLLFFIHIQYLFPKVPIGSSLFLPSYRKNTASGTCVSIFFYINQVHSIHINSNFKNRPKLHTQYTVQITRMITMARFPLRQTHTYSKLPLSAKRSVRAVVPPRWRSVRAIIPISPAPLFSPPNHVKNTSQLFCFHPPYILGLCRVPPLKKISIFTCKFFTISNISSQEGRRKKIAFYIGKELSGGEYSKYTRTSCLLYPAGGLS